MGRITAFVYGVFCYLVFLATFLYAMGFLGNFGVPKSIDSAGQSTYGEELLVYAGLLGMVGSAPKMTAAHLVFAVATTVYILVAIQLEERDLERMHGQYAEYRRRVPMIVPTGASVPLEGVGAGRPTGKPLAGVWE